MAVVDASAEPEISDEELELLALAATADIDLPDDALPWRPDGAPEALIGDWYMPAAGGRRDWRTRVVAGAIVGSILAINAAGLCVTYGRVILG